MMHLIDIIPSNGISLELNRGKDAGKQVFDLLDLDDEQSLEICYDISNDDVIDISLFIDSSAYARVSLNKLEALAFKAAIETYLSDLKETRI